MSDTGVFKPFTVIIDDRETQLTIDMAKGDQMTILHVVMTKIREWIKCSTTDDPEIAKTFTPLRLTVRGAAGAGKSFFIKCLVNTITKIFDGARVVEVAGPTGASAYNVGGETLHRKWSINPHKPSQELGKEAAENLKRKHKRTLAVVIDERSMLTSDGVGAAERNSAATAHGGSHDNEDWGGIPVVIFVGDDYQLPPPTNREKGAFDIMDSRSSYSQQKFGVASSGASILESMADNCMELTSIKRQNHDQTLFKEVLERLRIGEATNDDADYLMNLHLSNFKKGDVDKMKGSGVTMNLFATKAPRDEHNFRELSLTSSADNPVALLKAQWNSSVRGLDNCKIHTHFRSPPSVATILSRGALVRIVDKNFEPTWGLYNNAIGKVVEIVFAPGKDPNNGDLPSYVAVRFESYCGPTWDESDPKVVPVPMVTLRCDKKCCSATFCPLEIAFGMTLHTFQGQSAGPVEKGQPKNSVDRVIVEPGTTGFEGNNPGTLYMAVSRATTTGSNGLDSALFFTGPNMGRHRVTDIKLKRHLSGGGAREQYKKVALREKWVEKLEQNTKRPAFLPAVLEETKEWCKKTLVTVDELDEALARRHWRSNMQKGTNY